MPPKKKKSGKKKKGKKSGRKSAARSATSIGDTLNDLSKEFYLVQIRDLENRLVRYQKKCDMLEVMNGQFTDQYNQMSTDKKEIVAFLKKSLEQRGDEIADLNDRLVGLQQAKENEKDSYEQQLTHLRTEFNETKDQLTQENVILGSKLASLEEFKFQKESLMNKFAAMEQELERQQLEHKDILYNLERKAVVDKDRLKKEMVMRVNQVAAEFRKVSNKQMAETTKRTIRENVSINAQLTKMSDKTMELIQENDELKQKEKKQRQDIELLETNEKELAKKNHSNQKIIKMLTEKCKTQEAMLAEYEMRENEYQEIDTESDLLRQQVESTRDELQSLAKENEQLEDDLDSNKKSMKDVKKKNMKLEKVVTEAALALKICLTDTPEAWDGSTKYDEEEKRDGLLEHMLLLLNSAAAIGVGPSPGDMGKQYVVKRSKSALSEMPGSRQGSRKGTLSPLSRLPPGSGLPHYQLGDLGLIPRPSQPMQSKADKMKELSRTTQLGSLRKVLTKSVAIQTMSAPKAMFFADQLLSRTTPTAQTALLTADTPAVSRKSTAKSYYVSRPAKLPVFS